MTYNQNQLAYEALKAAQEWLQSPSVYQATHLPPTGQIDAALAQYADREETGPTCLHCLEPLDYDLKDICRDCQSDIEKEKDLAKAWADYCEARTNLSQYHHLRRS